MGLGGRPGEVACPRIDRRAGRGAGVKAERKIVGGKIRIARRGREGQQAAFVHRLVANGSQDRRVVDVVDSDRDRLEVAQRRRTVVGNANRHVIAARPLGLGRRPREVTCHRIDRRTGRGAGVKAERQRIGRDVRVARRGREGQQAAFIHRPVANRRQHRCIIDSVDHNRKRIVDPGVGLVCRPDRDVCRAAGIGNVGQYEVRADDCGRHQARRGIADNRQGQAVTVGGDIDVVEYGCEVHHGVGCIFIHYHVRNRGDNRRRAVDPRYGQIERSLADGPARAVADGELEAVGIRTAVVMDVGKQAGVDVGLGERVARGQQQRIALQSAMGGRHGQRVDQIGRRSVHVRDLEFGAVDHLGAAPGQRCPGVGNQYGDVVFACHRHGDGSRVAAALAVTDGVAERVDRRLPGGQPLELAIGVVGNRPTVGRYQADRAGCIHADHAQRIAVRIRIVAQHADRDGCLFIGGRGVRIGCWRVVHAGDDDRDGRRVEPALTVADGVHERIDARLAHAERFEPAVRIVRQRAVAVVRDLPRRPCGVHAGDGQCQAVHVAVIGQDVEDRRRPLVGQSGVRGGNGGVVYAGNRDGDRGHIDAATAVTDGVGERVARRIALPQ